MTERIRIPGRRDVRASLDSADTAAGEAESVVVACPPHPQMRGDRHDSRLQGVSDAVTGRGIDCLRFDYGPWDEGRGERTDVRNALAWAAERYDRVGLFGFSVLSALAPAAQVADDGDVVAALDHIQCPVQVVYGERDDTADWEPVVERARALGYEVVGLPADHFFVGQQAKAADRVCAFLCGHLG
ncbi:alpha/beta hydrolase [Halobacteriales archaeon QH_6_66_25]|nr:MAG: alpha/beta hydrolase [Halobacteriales archaeon QH_6_66_25]